MMSAIFSELFSHVFFKVTFGTETQALCSTYSKQPRLLGVSSRNQLWSRIQIDKHTEQQNLLEGCRTQFGNRDTRKAGQQLAPSPKNHAPKAIRWFLCQHSAGDTSTVPAAVTPPEMFHCSHSGHISIFVIPSSEEVHLVGWECVLVFFSFYSERQQYLRQEISQRW